MLNQLDSFVYSTAIDDKKILLKSSKLEILAARAIIGTVTIAIVLLLSTCMIVLIINLNRLTGAAVDYATEQSQHNPAVAATVESRATVEGVQISQVANYTNMYCSYNGLCSKSFYFQIFRRSLLLQK